MANRGSAGSPRNGNNNGGPSPCAHRRIVRCLNNGLKLRLGLCYVVSYSASGTRRNMGLAKLVVCAYILFNVAVKGPFRAKRIKSAAVFQVNKSVFEFLVALQFPV